MMAVRRASTPRSVLASVMTMGSPRDSASDSTSAEGAPPARSALLRTRIAGVPRCLASAAISRSLFSRPWADATMSARSTHSSTVLERSTRARPSSPTSSIPAVSMKTTGPMGASSQAFSTGSVVVPGTSETMEMCWCVNALASELLPALRRPKRPIWMRRPLGVSSMVNSEVLMRGAA